MLVKRRNETLSNIGPTWIANICKQYLFDFGFEYRPNIGMKRYWYLMSSQHQHLTETKKPMLTTNPKLDPMLDSNVDTILDSNIGIRCSRA